jgi:hypothetical protein
MQIIRIFFLRKIFRKNPAAPEIFQKKSQKTGKKKSGRAGKFFRKILATLLSLPKKKPAASNIRPKKGTPGKTRES